MSKKTLDFLINLISLFAFFWIFVFIISFFPEGAWIFALADLTLALIIWEVVERKKYEMKGGK